MIPHATTADDLSEPTDHGDRRTDWMKQGACVDKSRDLWFPEGSYQQARQVCDGCPVADRCLDYALEERIQFGMFGGLSPRERDALRRQQQAA